MPDQNDTRTTEHRIAALPAPLRPAVERHWSAYRQSGSAGLAPDQRLAESLPKVWAASDFAALNCIRHPELLPDLTASGDLFRRYNPDDWADHLTDLRKAADEPALGAGLRRLRRREMTRIAWRDIAGWAPLDDTMNELSSLADGCITHGLRRLQEWQSRQYGTAYGSDGRPLQLLVIAMGKLGAHELNFSSDIDLIFAYAEDGETRDGPHSLTHDEYFTRLGRKLIKLLNEVTAEGFVFRVDMRLRPFGDSGPLAMSFDALENYYQLHGRDWERYAMIKARVVNGDPAAGAQLLTMLRPFVYRRYLDFGSFQALRDMKDKINAEVMRKGMTDNVKLGPGGIREVEFIGQAFQLIRGGRQPQFQERRILAVLDLLADEDLLPEFVVRELKDAYIFLRNTEHRLQEVADQQVQQLPTDDTGRSRLAFAMDYPDWTAFERALRRHMRLVHNHFEQVVAAPQLADGPAETTGLAAAWKGAGASPALLAALQDAGFAAPETALEKLTALRQSATVKALTSQGRERLDSLMPLLLGAVGAAADPDATLPRLLTLVETIARRSAYLALLAEHPMALSQLARLCGASPWISHYLTRSPLLLDELLDPRSLYAPPDRLELAEDLRQHLSLVPDEDLEQQMDALRHFKQSQVLRVAAADIAEAMPLMVVSDHLTWIAEVILNEVLELAWRHLTARHGRPSCRRDASGSGFAVIAYGKLGGIELGYGSDLDIVFLHASADDSAMTDGGRPIADSVFFARLGQRIIHLLTAHTPAGVLYVVDTRLRPSGASGLLVTSLPAFADYQSKRAWTWEHQALVRTRCVAGDDQLTREFGALRQSVLGQARDLEKLRQEVRDMRDRMRRELDQSTAERFDLKQGGGGIADIEFMVQYGVLAWAHRHADLLEYPDNIRILAALARNGLLSQADADLLSDAYRTYRARQHRLTLQDQPPLVAATEFTSWRDGVTAIWQQLMQSA